MRQALKLVLFISVLIGLFGQTVSIAASPGVATTIERMTNSPMPAECLGMMKDSDRNSLPCDRMTLACIAGMGCVTIVALDIPRPVVPEPMVGTMRPAPLPFKALHGLSVQPEPHPPSTLV